MAQGSLGKRVIAMRELMNIVEHEGREYFHGSRRNFEIGHVLAAHRPRLEPEEKAVELILERFRPEDCLPRNKCIFMVAQPDPDLIERAGGYAQYIYQVEPQGRVERNDVHWWAKILNEGAIDVFKGTPEEKAEALVACQPMAEAYWLGDASERPLWEYRSVRGVITAIIA